jgi:replication-associated recombination protein RarA
MKNLLLSERWRPKNLEDIILLPRIRKIFENGLNNNVVLYGHFGTGKTTLARILIGKYTKDKPFLELNSSFYTSVDTLRTKIDEFCSKVYMGFDLDKDIDRDETKYVFLDEFERTSIQYQDALKAYIEEFSRKNVRFIFTTNHINKVSPGIRSRLIEVNFDCQTPEEERFLKQEIYKKVKNKICPEEGFDIGKDELVKIINKKFPDFRSILIELDNFKITGTLVTTSTTNLKLKNDTYSLIYDKTKTYEDIYHFLMANFGPEKIDELLNLFGRQFIDYSLAEKRTNIEKLFQVNYIICEHQHLLETNTDPIILGMTVVGKIRDLF